MKGDKEKTNCVSNEQDTFASLIIEARERNGLSFADMGKAYGKQSRQYMEQLQNGRYVSNGHGSFAITIPHKKNLKKLSKALNIRYADLAKALCERIYEFKLKYYLED